MGFFAAVGISILFLTFLECLLPFSIAVLKQKKTTATYFYCTITFITTTTNNNNNNKMVAKNSCEDKLVKTCLKPTTVFSPTITLILRFKV